MLTLCFRPLRPLLPHPLTWQDAVACLSAAVADLTGAEVITTVTPVRPAGACAAAPCAASPAAPAAVPPGAPPLAQASGTPYTAPPGAAPQPQVSGATPNPLAGGAPAWAAHWVRWQTHNTRDRLVVESTWHHAEGLVMVDAHLGAVPWHRAAFLYTLCQQAAQAGYRWAGIWREGEEDPLADGLGFLDAAGLVEEGLAPPPLGRQDLGPDLVLEWLRPSPRIMKRLIYFAEDCRIDWESLIVEDLMEDTPATYVEVRQGRETLALARVLRSCYLPGMDGYDPRSRTPPVALEIESLEVHPDHRSHGYGALLVRAIQALRRPVITLDTYRRAEGFWARMGFQHNARRSSREDSNIFEWLPSTGEAVRSTCGG